MFFPILLVFGNWAIFIFRIVLGIIFVAHGLPKLKNLKGTAGWFDSVGFKPGRLWAPIVAVVEFVGGLALILGIFVQPVAFLLTIQFLVIAFWKIKTKQKLIGGLELDLVFLVAALVLLTVDTEINLFNFFYWLGIG